MDGPALGTGLFGILVGAGACYLVMTRRWLALICIVSIGAAGMLSLVTEGPRPHEERTAVSAAVYALLFIFLVAVIVQQLRARRHGAATRRP
jgi:uncharacterized membrane protein